MISPRNRLLRAAAVLFAALTATAANRASAQTLVQLEQTFRGAGPPLVSADGRHLYVAVAPGELDIYAHDPRTSTYDFVATARHPALDGRFLLVPARSILVTVRSSLEPEHGFLDVFVRDAESGLLEHRASLSDIRLSGASSVVADPEGRFLFVGQSAPFPGDLFEGGITFVELDSATATPRIGYGTFGSAGMPGDSLQDYIRDLALVGNRLLVLSAESNPFQPRAGRIDEYEVQPRNGGLHWLARWQATPLDGGMKLAVSADGRHVYASSIHRPPNGPPVGLVFALSRDPDTGLSTAIQSLSSAEPGLEDLVSSDSLRLATRDDLLLVPGGRGIAVLDRDRASGLLELAEWVSPPQDPANSGRWLDVDLDPTETRLVVSDTLSATTFLYALPCRPDEDTACLHEGRFQVDVAWRDFAGTPGVGHPLGVPSDRSGLFWFFRPDNWEMLVKVLDGCTNNGHFWVLGAATTNVAYDLSVTDTWAATRVRYGNDLGTAAPATVDSRALATCQTSLAPPVLPGPPPTPTTPRSPCIDGQEGLCLLGGRFRVEVAWEDFRGRAGVGTPIPFEADDSGLLWFFAPDNWEMLVKVLDGCANNDRFWVFAAATTNVAYELEVTDLLTSESRTWSNPLGSASDAITDTSAFATCP